MTINFEKTENGYIELDEDERTDIYERLIKAEAKYGFEKHKGYGTKLHTEKILEYGPCPIHRMSFLKKLYEKK